MQGTGHTWLEAPAYVQTRAGLEPRSGVSLPRPTYLYLLQWHLKNSFIELRSLPIGSANRTALTGVQRCAPSLPPMALRGRTAGSCDKEEGRRKGGSRAKSAATGGREPRTGSAHRRGSSGRGGEGRRWGAERGGHSRGGGRSGRPGAANSGNPSIFRRESGTSVG